MRRPHRITQRRDFRRLYRQGRTYRGLLITVRTFQSFVPKSRFGFAVRREVGMAVVRNRVKRQLREVARSLPVVPGWDVLITARGGAKGATYPQLLTAVESLLSRARLIEQAKP